MPAFTAGKPPANEVLAISQGFLKDNLDYLQQTGNVDHFYSTNTATTNNGFHSVVHMINNATPAPVSNVGALYSNSTSIVGTGQQLMYRGPGGLITQLTSSANTSPGVNGSTSLTDGVFMIWGNVITGATFGSVSFSPAFTTVYAVQATLINNATPNGNGTISIDQSPNGSGFSWKIFTNSGAYPGFYWSAIGTV